MSLSFRARVINATQRGAPAGDVLRLVHPAHFLLALKSAREAFLSQAARGGMEFVKALCLETNPARPAPRRKRPTRPKGEESPPAADRAAGALEEVVRVTGHVEAHCCRAVFGRRVMTFQSQCWYLGVAKKMCEQLAPPLTEEPDAVKRWSQRPFLGERPFLLPCKGGEVARPPAKGAKPVEYWRSAPGCSDCQRRVMLVIRGATQLACRLKRRGDPERTWVLRATHSPGEGRFPFAQPRSECATARRIVRGHPGARCSAAFWPVKIAPRRPEA